MENGWRTYPESAGDICHVLLLVDNQKKGFHIACVLSYAQDACNFSSYLSWMMMLASKSMYQNMFLSIDELGSFGVSREFKHDQRERKSESAS